MNLATKGIYNRAALGNNEAVTVILLGALAKGVLGSDQVFLPGGNVAISKMPSTVERTRQAVNQQ